VNNTRKTFNTYLSTVVLPTLPAGWAFSTGDGPNVVIADKTLAVEYITGSIRGMSPESRIRLAQLEVYIGDSATDEAEAACDAVLAAMQLNTGQNPLLVIPKLAWNGATSSPLGTELRIRRQLQGGWNSMEGPSQDSRLYILTLELDYIPG
jgi:hypothetical protein